MKWIVLIVLIVTSWIIFGDVNIPLIDDSKNLAPEVETFKDNTGCPQPDPNQKDVDGVMYCPDAAKQNAWSVYRCAIDQAKIFHNPSQTEMMLMSELLVGWTKQDVVSMGGAAKDLNLIMCRVSQVREGGAKDSYLLFYVKPGIKDYSGPFMMLRESGYSKLLVIGPHDDSDGTAYDTKTATAATHAMGTISNGHRRGNVRKGRPPGYRNDDFCHADSKTSNLGTWAVSEISRLKKSSVILHIHGMADHTKVLDRPKNRNMTMKAAFEKAIMKHTYVRQFKPLNAYFIIDSVIPDTNWYIKAEIPVRVHNNNPQAMANVVREIEENYDWAKN